MGVILLMEDLPRSSRTFQLPQDSKITLEDLYSFAQNILTISREDFYFTCNGKILNDDSMVSDGVVRILPRLVGGKGGFGSMLRAIGAQIEKTTNREACRDLSGRRLRDINEEKRLKNWISKKAEREREAEERRKRKLEKLRAEPKIEFSDKNYEQERTKLSEVVHDAVEKGFQATTSKPGSSFTTKKPVTKKKGFMLEEEEISDDSSDASSDNSDIGSEPVKPKEEESDEEEPSPAKKLRLNDSESSSNEGCGSSKPTQEESDSDGPTLPMKQTSYDSNDSESSSDGSEYQGSSAKHRTNESDGDEPSPAKKRQRASSNSSESSSSSASSSNRHANKQHKM